MPPIRDVERIRTRSASGTPEEHPQRERPPVARIVALQRSAGNAAVAGLLGGAAVPGARLHRRIPEHEAEHRAVETRDEQRHAAREAEFEARANAASKKIDASGHKQGAPLSGTGTAPTASGTGMPQWFMDLQQKLYLSEEWGQEEEDAQQVLEDYLTFWLESRPGAQIPGNLRYLFQYAGRSSIHAAKAKKGGFQAVSDSTMGGGLVDGKPTKNWCTQATTTGLLEALRSMGFAPVDATKFFNTVVNREANGQKMSVYGEAAYTEPLLPGDQVMYLFESGQYGGHTVTVVDDLGDSFTHISGNTGAGIGTGVGEAKRRRTPPTPKSGNAAWKLHMANRVLTQEDRTASTQYIRSHNFDGQVLVYSIVRYGQLLLELERLPELEKEEQDKVLAKFGLRRLRPAAPAGGPPPPAPTSPAP